MTSLNNVSAPSTYYQPPYSDITGNPTPSPYQWQETTNPYQPETEVVSRWEYEYKWDPYQQMYVLKKKAGYIPFEPPSPTAWPLPTLQLTEEDVRRIIREELAELLKKPVDQTDEILDRIEGLLEENIAKP